MKAINIILVTLAVTSLVACGTSLRKSVGVIGADKQNGVVSVGFIYTENAPFTDNGTEAHWEDAAKAAEEFCQEWGFANAEPLTKTTKKDGFLNGDGQLMYGAVYYKYQCKKQP